MSVEELANALCTQNFLFLHPRYYVQCATTDLAEATQAKSNTVPYVRQEYRFVI